jgi:hypothetical protein
MHWILESNLSDYAYQCLILNLKQKGIKNTMVKVVPCEDILLPPYFAKKPEAEDNVIIDNNEKIFPFGTMGLSRVAKTRNWTPGSLFNDNFNFNKWSVGFGRENLLNKESKIMKMGDNLDISDSMFFVRPCEDDKAFSGKIISRDKFLEWQLVVLNYMEGNKKLNADTEITVAPYREIQQEARMFVFDKKVVTASYYKIGAKVIYERVLNGDPITDYTNEIISHFEPAKAYVIDIAKTPNGYKIIEINNINSVGLYQADECKFVDAVMNTFS